MKKTAVFGVLLLLAVPVFCQDAGTVDLLRGLNEGLNQNLTKSSFFKNAMENGNFPFLPGLYLSRRRATYVTFGVMINDEENQSPDEVLQTAILLKAAFLVRRNKANSILFFDYYKNGNWGLSFKIKY